jgi:hypothetical protein
MDLKNLEQKFFKLKVPTLALAVLVAIAWPKKANLCDFRKISTGYGFKNL